jgi:hypothetical protein
MTELPIAVDPCRCCLSLSEIGWTWCLSQPGDFRGGNVSVCRFLERTVVDPELFGYAVDTL